jgi:hypothetical protein
MRQYKELKEPTPTYEARPARQETWQEIRRDLVRMLFLLFVYTYPLAALWVGLIELHLPATPWIMFVALSSFVLLFLAEQATLS